MNALTLTDDQAAYLRKLLMPATREGERRLEEWGENKDSGIDYDDSGVDEARARSAIARSILDLLDA